MLGELSRLLVQLKQSTNWVKDAWFIVDLDGFCSGMNLAAETLCGLRLGLLPTTYGRHLFPSSPTPVQSTVLKIEDVFENLLPRMRNAEEVEHYLQDFTHGSMYRQELRCVLATEPGAIHQYSQEMDTEHRLRDESALSDNHYQFTRYPLYNQQGQLAANALQVRM